MIVSDNTAVFTSLEFQEFLSRSSPYHPSTNSLAERSMQTVKEGLRKLTGSLETQIYRFLFDYRITSHSTTGQLPSELLFGRKTRSHWDLIFPDAITRVKMMFTQLLEISDTVYFPYCFMMECWKNNGKKLALFPTR